MKAKINIKHINEKNVITSFFLITILSIIFVLAAPPTWVGDNVNYTATEDTALFHNLSANITGYNDEINFTIDTENNINWTNGSGTFSFTKEFVSSWISILNSTIGNFTINATRDNETGFFVIPIQATNNTNSEGAITNFEFLVNATNDLPILVDINATYNVTSGETLNAYLNATDEENHFPLIFNISFENDCSLANYSTRGAGNCSLFNATFFSNTSALMNFTPIRNDVGIYTFNLSVIDSGKNYNCSSTFCATGYSTNQTTYHTQLITLNVLSTLFINATNCQNQTFQENQESTCFIEIDVKESNNTLNISSNGSVRNYPAIVSNVSWFYGTQQLDAEGFFKNITINVTPTKTEIGNWTINFTVEDLNRSETTSVLIFINVNKTADDSPEIASIDDKNTSINLLTTINISVFDDDLLIPDKLEGYNETINFSVQILNQSNLSKTETLQGFDVEITAQPVSGTNRTEAKIEFTPNSTEFGDYFINITINDKAGNTNSTNFNLSIIDNDPPAWDATVNNNTLTFNEDDLIYFNFTQNVSDPDGDSLNFSFTNETGFENFAINTSSGEVNFTARDLDVGEHLINITISDRFLNGSRIFNFTINNIDDNLSIETLTVTNGTVDSNSNVNTTEDNFTTINLFIQDDDVLIPTDQQTAFYNESFTVILTIVGNNTNLFSFVKNNNFPAGDNRSKYEAIFTPNKSDVGTHNITVNVTDSGGSSQEITFNLTIFELEHNPKLITVFNQTSAVNRSYFFQFNVSDTEDGDTNQTGGNTNFKFNYTFLYGIDFINNNETLFNTTTGELNITFNDSQYGKYQINITVNDSSQRQDHEDYWLHVYGNLSINFPPIIYEFNLTENVTANLTFGVDNNISDNLTYEIYIKNYENITALRSNVSSFGNGTNFTLAFTPNFTDETGGVKTLELRVYPSTGDLENATEINVTQNWNITIDNDNYPITFDTNISDFSGATPKTITLSDSFTDVDATDKKHNQTIRFVHNITNSSGSITVFITNWTNSSTPKIKFSVLATSNGNYTIVAYEYNESNSTQIINNATSNLFSIVLSTTTLLTPTPSAGGGGGGGGGGGTTKFISIDIITPGRIDKNLDEEIIIPISIENKGDKTLNKITLTAIVLRDGDEIQEAILTFQENFIETLKIGEEIETKLRIEFNAPLTGEYEIIINAVSQIPSLEDSATIYLDLNRLNETDVETYIIFTEEFIAQNPVCVEIQEIIDEANKLFERGRLADARLKAEQAINACKDFIAQASTQEKDTPIGYIFNNILILTTLGSFLLGISYYIFKRRRFQKIELKDLNQQSL